MEESGSLRNEIEHNRLLFTRKGTEQILKYADELRAKHYGMIMPWSEVQQRLPRRSVFSIIDFEKGFTFRVQRRASPDMLSDIFIGALTRGIMNFLSIYPKDCALILQIRF